MAKAVLISIRPEWVEKIANEIKTVEVRKSKPNLEMPFKCYIYCTNTRPFLVWGDVFRGDWCTEFTHLSGYGRAKADKIWDVFNGNVAGEFVVDAIITDKTSGHDALFNACACMSEDEVVEYSAGNEIYGWHISELKIYDMPRAISEFTPNCRFLIDEGECQYRKVLCDRQRIDYNPDGSPNIVLCERRLQRPPQSWCYVEELT